jgi:hypothetical protein
LSFPERKKLLVLNDAGLIRSFHENGRQKELASQMGIDVAWNCAISLRPLESGEDDPHRMVSNYADWDINAKLPHGVEDVRKHLKEVDNVPLLVSLYGRNQGDNKDVVFRSQFCVDAKTHSSTFRSRSFKNTVTR